jgi:peptidoglycan/LPS O-acetylase OafA/YrhL
LLVMLAPAAKLVDYGAEGWLWALFGLCQRRYVDGRSAADGRSQVGLPPPHAAENAMRLLACLVAAVVYVWQEQREYSFPQVHFTVLIAGVGMLSLALCLFERGRSPVQPPRSAAGVLRFIGRRTLEIYTIQLAGSELLVKLLPGLAS